MELYDIIALSLKKGGADVYIVPGSPLVIKCKGRFENVTDVILTEADTEILLREIYGICGNRPLDDLLYSGDDDFSFSVQNLGRFRCMAYRQKGSLAAILRIVSNVIPTPEKLGIPAKVMEIANLRKGLVFVTGPSGSGKSTTIACMLDHINKTRKGHIVTIEEPIEYIHSHAGCIVSQREINTDTGSFSGAVKTAMRQGADVIMLGTLPDSTTVQNAINAATMGRLVLVEGYIYGFSKLVESLVDSMPSLQQELLRTWLAVSMSAVVVQKLIPTIDGDVVPIFSVVNVTPEISAAIKEGIDLMLCDGDLDAQLFDLWKSGRVSREDALANACEPHAMSLRMDEENN